MTEETKKKKKLSDTGKILLGLIFGAVFGIILNYLVPDSSIKNDVVINGVLYVIGNGFLKLMKMLVVPLVFTSLICGAAAIGDTKTLGKVGVKTIALYICTTALAVSVAIGVANLIRPGIGLNMSEIQAGDAVTTTTTQTGMADTLLDIIPDNPFGSLANGTMLQIIVFALIVGILIAKMGERAELLFNFASQCNDLMMEMTMFVMKAAPIGVFCLIAKTFSGLGLDAIIPLLKYVISVIAALAVQCFGVYMLLLFGFTRLNPVRFFKKFLPVFGFAFSTATSNATIPLSIETLEDKMGVSRRISSFTIPLGATINMDGTSIMQGVAVVFASQAYGIHLGLNGYLTVIATATLASIGTAGVPSVGLITLSMVFQSVGLPIEAIALIMGIDRILDMIRTAVNVTGDAVCTTIVAFQNKAVDIERFRREK
ncbi:dicarboxylate/amino acid:cation symporter [Roseburia sp. MUC/MUC-530-WT-4D]|uniref:Dicarboxylate/amino acid:cation symporter n=1 Tax=Roseburia porci TaxID=2605790 RepID=A0A6L5YU40_9FIRM|nr:dicarboxylate/amino acid:cation symporter [Roseburia porci]MCI5516334.1 dicarboxylate/amino acid:cation symporter [Roseburia sp.]MDD6742108.1 dicarboxylate/amino acid:cation symporter [Roseburia porci]MST75990.1 dicarboxylate/amino acid:cation symporter [Roseburia porci]